MEISLKPRAVLLVLLASIAGLVVAHVVGLVLTYRYGHDYVYGLVPLFNLDGEGNAPAWFGSGLLMSCGFLLLAISLGERAAGRKWGSWALLAFVFLFLSLDEAAMIHERIGFGVGDAVGVSGTLREYAWVGPYGIAVVVLAIGCFRFVLRLPRQIRNLMIASAVIFVGGAIGVEILGSVFWNSGAIGWRYYSMVTVEEACEMLGSSLFLYTLLAYMQIRDAKLVIE